MSRYESVGSKSPINDHGTWPIYFKMGLHKDSKDITEDALKEALYSQFGLEFPKKIIVHESIVNPDISPKLPMTNNNNQLFHRKKILEEKIIEENDEEIIEENDVKQASRCSFGCNIF